MRSDALSGSGVGVAGEAGVGTGRASTGVGADLGSGAGSGTVVQPAINSNRNANAVFVTLVTEPYAHYIDLCRPEPAASNVQFFQIINRPHVDSIIVAVINACTLDPRFNAM